MSRTVRIGKEHVDIKWTAIDRLIEYVAPVAAGRRMQARVGHAMMGRYNGASRSRRSLKAWNPRAGDADDDIIPDLATLRDRCVDLDANAPVAGGAINTTVTNTIGTGLSLQPQLDHLALGLSEDQAAAWQADAERKFRAWADSPDFDSTRHHDFYGMQALAFRSALVEGDCLGAFVKATSPSAIIPLALQLIPSARVCNPDNKPDSKGLVQGVELTAQGAPVAYHVASRHPRHRVGNRGSVTWTRLPAFGSKTGRRTVLHLMDRKRIGATRGVPFLASVIEPLKQLERYTEAELMAAVVSGMFTVFIKTEGATSITPSAQAGATAPEPLGGMQTIIGENGLMVELAPGEDITSANPGRPNAQFDPFVTAIIRQIGMQLEIPYEFLVKHYQESYSAARAAMNDAWRFFRTRRDWMATYFCQPVYEAWLEHAVSSGLIIAPGFFANPYTRRAWSGAAWVGDGPGSLDPLKEAKAARERVELTISTLAQESILHDGGDWTAKQRQRAREESLRIESGLGPTEQANTSAATITGQGLE